MAAIAAVAVPSSAILGGDLRDSWSWQGSCRSGEVRHVAQQMLVQETGLKKKMGGRGVSDASTAVPECELANELADAPADEPKAQGVPSSAILGGDLRDSWSWHGSCRHGEAASRAAGPAPRDEASAATSGFEGVPSAAILGGDVRGAWSWQGSCHSGERAARAEGSKVASAGVPEQTQPQGVPSSAILGGDLRGAWSWQGSCRSGEKPQAREAPTAPPAASFEGLPSAAILGGDVRGAWSWQGSCRSGEGRRSKKQGQNVMDSAALAKGPCSSAKGVPSSVILGAQADGAAWRWC